MVAIISFSVGAWLRHLLSVIGFTIAGGKVVQIDIGRSRPAQSARSVGYLASRDLWRTSGAGA